MRTSTGQIQNFLAGCELKPENQNECYSFHFFQISLFSLLSSFLISFFTLLFESCGEGKFVFLSILFFNKGVLSAFSSCSLLIFLQKLKFRGLYAVSMLFRRNRKARYGSNQTSNFWLYISGICRVCTDNVRCQKHLLPQSTHKMLKQNSKKSHHLCASRLLEVQTSTSVIMNW